MKQIKADTKIQTITLVSNRSTSITDLHKNEKQSVKVTSQEKISRSEREIICSRETNLVPYQVNLLLRRCYCPHPHGGVATFTGESCVNMCADCGLCGSRPTGCRLQGGVSTCIASCVPCSTCTKTVHGCYTSRARNSVASTCIAQPSRAILCALCCKNTASASEWNLCTECEGVVTGFLVSTRQALNSTDTQTDIRDGDVINKGLLFRGARSPSFCSKLLKWLLALLLSYLVFYTFMLWLADQGGCPGRSWRWWRHLSSPLNIKSHHSRPS